MFCFSSHHNDAFKPRQDMYRLQHKIIIVWDDLSQSQQQMESQFQNFRERDYLGFRYDKKSRSLKTFSWKISKSYPK